MECDYCGLATGAVARWEVSSGWPDEGMTRYVCTAHRPAAVALVAMVGPVQVIPTNTEYWRRLAEVVALLPRTEPIGEAA